MPHNERYKSYLQLLDKVDAMFAAIVNKHPGQFACKKGCSMCCVGGLTISNIEVNYIRDWMRRNPNVLEKINRKSDAVTSSGACAMLDENRACLIYEARPLICRSHGLPITTASVGDEVRPGEQGQNFRDVCPLNFQGVDLSALDHASVLDIDKLNTLLSLINRVFDADNSERRERIDALF